MQIIFLCLALIIYISLVFAVKFPIDSEGKSLAPLIRSGGFSLAATLVLLIISRLMIDWSAALEELFQILYGFLLLICHLRIHPFRYWRLCRFIPSGI